MDELNKYPIEAIAGSNLLQFPNFHVLAYRDDNGIMAAHCLDFDLWAYSKDQDNKEAIKKVFKRICEMVTIHIIGHLKRKTIDHLYDNRLENKGEWEEFSKQYCKTKIQNLRESYNKLIANPSGIKEKIEGIKASIYDFSHLKQETFQDLKRILDHLTNVTIEEAEELIQEMLTLLPSNFQLKVAA